VKHLEAGLLIGAAWALALVILIGLVAIFNTLIGTAFTVAIFATTIIVIGVAAFIDWKTEKRGS
jgi:hypothetical protein